MQAELKAEAEWLDNLTFLVADIDACSFPAGAFDAVLCSSALPFLPDIPASLARWHTWLRPTGRVVFNVPKVRAALCTWWTGRPLLRQLEYHPCAVT